MQDILGVIRQEVQDYTDNTVEVVPGYDFAQYDTIQKIHLYISSRFKSGDTYNGRKRIFFNIVNPRRDTVTRFLDINTKDIRVYELNEKSHFAAPFLEYELKKFLVANDFAAKLNKMAENVTTYGTIILEHSDGKPQIRDLRYIFMDPTVETIKESRFVIVKHFFTAHELRAQVKKGWDEQAIENIIDRKAKLGDAKQSYVDGGSKNSVQSSSYIEVYARYGYVSEEVLTGKYNEDAEEKKSIVIAAEPFLKESDSEGKAHDAGEILYSSEWRKGWPFSDFHFQKIAGRYLGLGVVEALFPAQERVNELANQKRISMELSTLHLFQTSDPTILTNMLNDVQNGDVIKSRVPNAIQPVANEERNLAAFNQEEDRYALLADRISFANDLLAGGQIPTSTAATTAVIQNNNASSVHLFKRQNYANFLRVYFREFVLPQLVKEINTDKIIRYVGERDVIEQIDEMFTNQVVNEEVVDQVSAGEQPSIDTVEEITQELKTSNAKLGGKRFVKRLKDFYKDKEFELDIIIDNEQEDVSTIANNTFQFLTLLAQNPALITQPLTKELAMSYGKKIGVNPEKLEIAASKQAAIPIEPENVEQQQAQPLQKQQLAKVQ